MAEPPSPPEPPSGEEPIASRLLETGVGVTQRVARVTGVDQALNTASEEAIVGAFESPAFERALIRLAEDGRLLEVLERAVGTADVEDAVTMALDSQAADRIWAEILASDKAQMLVERVAEAPEVRAAIAQQGLGLLGDIGLQIRRLTRPLDRVLERIARALVRRSPRTEPTEHAGLATRSLAGAVDLLLLVGSLALISAVIAAVKTAIFGPGDGLSADRGRDRCRPLLGPCGSAPGLLLGAGRTDARDGLPPHPPRGRRRAPDRLSAGVPATARPARGVDPLRYRISVDPDPG